MKKINEQEKFVIVEIIPTSSNPLKGKIVQISALKLQGLTLIDRFDYRLNENLITNQDIKRIISYDKNSFQYLKTSAELIEKFKMWTENLKLLILDNGYTLDYLKSLSQPIIPITNYLELPSSEDIIEKIISKYQLQPTNYIVDLLYETLIYESNKK